MFMGVHRDKYIDEYIGQDRREETRSAWTGAIQSATDGSCLGRLGYPRPRSWGLWSGQVNSLGDPVGK
jgi:hypothetical protein